MNLRTESWRLSVPCITLQTGGGETQQHVGAVLESGTCPLCGKHFPRIASSWRQKLERHLLTHTGEKPYRCPYCHHRSGRKDSIKRHSRIMHPDKPPLSASDIVLACDQSGLRVWWHFPLGWLQHHTYLVHYLGAMSGSVCREAGSGLNTEWVFVLQETGVTWEAGMLLALDMDQKCRICGKQFLPSPSWKQKLMRHLMTHSGAKPFCCPYCQYRCARRDSLKLHTIRKHGRNLPD